jgi:hypothetical protein
MNLRREWVSATPEIALLKLLLLQYDVNVTGGELGMFAQRIMGG